MNRPLSSDDNLRPDRLMAIKRSEELGRELAETKPEIADARRKGLSSTEIIDAFGLHQLAKSRTVVQNAVNIALRRLITDPEERAEINQRIAVKRGEEAAKKCEATKTGLYALTTEDRAEGGRKLYRDKGGVHAKSSDELKEYSRAAVLKRGQVPWHDNAVEITTKLDEYNYCWKLLADPNFKKKHMGILTVDLQKIADELNIIFHCGEPVRTRSAIAAVVQDKKKRG